MPRRRTVTRTRVRTVTRGRGRTGRGKFMNFLKKASKFLKRTKLISKFGKAYGSTHAPYSQHVNRAAGFAEQLGYGCRRRRRRVGGALRPASG